MCRNPVGLGAHRVRHSLIVRLSVIRGPWSVVGAPAPLRCPGPLRVPDLSGSAGQPAKRTMDNGERTTDKRTTIGSLAAAVNGPLAVSRGASLAGRQAGGGLAMDRPAALALGLDLLVSQVAEDFQDFTPGGKHPPAAALVLVHRHHELGLRLGVFALAGGRIDEPAPTAELARVGGAGGLFRGPAIDPFPGFLQRVRGFLGLCTVA